MPKLSIRDIDLANKRLFIRVFLAVAAATVPIVAAATTSRLVEPAGERGRDLVGLVDQGTGGTMRERVLP